MKDVSSNADLKNILMVKKSNQIRQIKFEYDGKSQSFKINFVWKKNRVKLPITCRTRAAGGWQGKSLFITTSGLTIV